MGRLARLATLGVPLSVGGALTADEFLQSLNPLWYAKFNEVAGDLIDHGSEGADGTLNGGVTQGAAAIEDFGSYLYDGVDDQIVIANADLPNAKAITTQRWVFLINATSMGENGGGIIFRWGNAAPTLNLTGTFRLRYAVTTDAIGSQALSNDNQVDFIGTDTLVFADYDDSGVLGLGRRCRIMRATAANATTLLTLATNTAATGTIVSSPDNLNIGARTLLNFTFDGLIALGFLAGGLWSPAGSPADLTVPDTIRSLVFGV